MPILGDPRDRAHPCIHICTSYMTFGSGLNVLLNAPSLGTGQDGHALPIVFDDGAESRDDWLFAQISSPGRHIRYAARSWLTAGTSCRAIKRPAKAEIVHIYPGCRVLFVRSLSPMSENNEGAE